MTFLQSFILFGLCSVILPFLIHLLNIRKRERVPFSSLYFLRLIESKKIKRLKLKQLLLLLIRMAIIAFLVTAFARPAVVGDLFSGYSETAQIAAVIVVDNSLSTSFVQDDQPLFEQIRSNALQVLDTFKDGDELYLLFSTDFMNILTDNPALLQSFESTVEQSVTSSNVSKIHSEIQADYSKESVQYRIENARIAKKEGNLTRAVAIGKTLLQESSYLIREIFVVSDMQASNFYHDGNKTVPVGVPIQSESGNPDTQVQNMAGTPPVQLIFIRVGEDVRENFGITHIAFEEQIVEQNKELRVRMTAGRFSSGSDVEVDRVINLYLNGKRIAQKSVKFTGDEIVTSEFRFVPESTEIINGMIEIEEDKMTSDNRRHFVVNIPPAVSVLLVNGNGTIPDFLESVYSSGLMQELSLRSVSESQMSSVEFRDYDSVILNGVSRFTNVDIYRIKNFCAGGGGVIIFPGRETDLDSFNKYLAEPFSLPAATGYSGEFLQSSLTGSSYFTIESVQYTHPIFNNMFQGENPEPDLPFIYRAIDLNITDPVRTRSIMSMSNNRPFIAETDVEIGTIVLFSSAPSLAWNSFPVQGLFAPLMYRLVNYVSRLESGQLESNEVGEQVTLMFRESPDDIVIKSPIGELFKEQPMVTSEAYTVNFSDTNEQGIYTLLNGESTLQKFAVNVSPKESITNPLSESEIEQFFGSKPYRVWDGEEDIAEKIRESRSGFEVSHYVIALVLLLLLMETLLQHERKRGELDEIPSV